MKQPKMAVIYATIPSPEEIEQLVEFTKNDYDLTVVTAFSIGEYIHKISRASGLKIITLVDHLENHTYLPGLEECLKGFEVVLLKERIGLYVYQAVKAKWIHRFKLIVLVDNLTPWPTQDIARLRTIRDEVMTAADCFVVQSQAAYEMLIDMEGILASRVHFVPPFVAASRIDTIMARDESLKSLGFYSGDFLITVFGQVEWEEGLYDIIHGVFLARKQNGADFSKIKLAICGVGSFDQLALERLESLSLAGSAKIFEPTRDTYLQLINASSAIFSSIIQSRDRLEGDPFKLMIAAANRIPVISGRTPMADEILGKWRLDFCLGNVSSIASAIDRGFKSSRLCSDIAAKAWSSLKTTNALDMGISSFKKAMVFASNAVTQTSVHLLDTQIREVERLTHDSKFHDAIKLIDRIFSTPSLAIYHKANLYRIIGDCFTKLGDGASGKEAYDTSLSLDPYFGLAWIGHGVLNLNQGNFDLAVINFQKAVTYAPQDDMACLGLGLAFQGISEVKEAGKWMERCLDLNPLNTTGLYSIVKLAHELKDFTLALPALEKYLMLKPTDLAVQYSLAGAYFAISDFKMCQQVLNYILAAEPNHIQALELKNTLSNKLDETEFKVG
jgi:tetratricopeptide (TPR) repeat protein